MLILCYVKYLCKYIPVWRVEEMHYEFPSVMQRMLVQALHSVFAQPCLFSQLTVTCTYSSIYKSSKRMIL